MYKYELKKVIKTDNKEITELNIKDIDDITYLGIMNSLDVTLKNAKDINTLRNLDNKNIIIELVNGITVLGSNMVQIASSEVNINDGVESFEFHGNVRIK